MPPPLSAKAIFYFLFLVSCWGLHSQNFIKGVVSDSTRVPVPFCTVALLKAKDSSVVKGNLTDEKGEFRFEKIAKGNYLIKYVNVGFRSLFSETLQVDSLSRINLGTISLKNDGVNLNEVSVSTFKPNIEFKKGMVVLNVENNILAGGNTVLELLKRVPGVVIDAQNNISINGKAGVRFLIDGRLQQIPTEQMMNMLSGMTAESVSTIELIKNPPAKYDAAGSAGLINIVMKKAKLKGFSGSLSQSTSKGVHFRNGSTAAFNFKSNKLSVFTNFSYYYQQFETNNRLSRQVNDSVYTYEAVSFGKQKPWRSILNLNGGIEYELNKKTTLGVNANFNPRYTGNAERAQANVLRTNDLGFDYFKFNINTREDANNPTLNLNAQHKFDTLGTTLNASADFSNYKENYSKYTLNRFYDPYGTEVMLPTQVRTAMDYDFKIYSQKLDLTREFKKVVNLETGVKSSFVTNTVHSRVELGDALSGELKADSNFSNNYNYHERILAAYVTLSRNIGKVDMRAGLRSEETKIEAGTDRGFVLKRQYLNFFPSASIDYKLNTKNSLQVNYSYRLDRPPYNQLNPTRVYNEQFNYAAGNPRLNPQYSHQAGIEYNYGGIVTLSAEYFGTKGFIYYYAYGNPATKTTIDTVFNYPRRDHFGLAMNIHKQIKWFNFQFFNVFMYRTLSGQVNGQTANSKTYEYYNNYNLEFILPKAFKLQLNGWYRSFLYDGVQVYYPIGSVNLGLMRSFFNKKLDISMSFYDVLYTEKFAYSNTVGGQHSYYRERNDSRRVRLFLVWRFGKMHIDHKLKSGNDEEKKRLKSAN